MTRDEAEAVAKVTARGLWQVEPPLRLWRYRRWLLAGPIRWEATGASGCSAFHLVVDDRTGETVQARKHPTGPLAPNSIEEIRGHVRSLIVLFALIGVVFAIRTVLPPWAIWSLSVVIGLGTLVWIRVRLMRRRQ